MPSAPIDPWLWSRTFAETAAASADPAGVALAQCGARLQCLLRVTLEHSPLYRARAGRAAALQDLPPIEKSELMQHFDDWATDRRITRASVDAFLADPEHLADAYLGRYLVWTSSGTTGEPGIFVQDAQSLAAFDALDALRLNGIGGGRPFSAAWLPGQRLAFVVATGGHFAGAASIERLRRMTTLAWPVMPWLAPAVRTYSIQTPLPELCAELQDFAPTVLVTYPSCAEVLAQAQAEGAMDLHLAEAWFGGEQLSSKQRQHIRAAFGCTLRNSYGASEFYAIAWECAHGRLHLNHDWVILEPVDRRLRPVPHGEASDSVLLTNLANTTQPLLRYRLGDSVRLLPGRCDCGSAFPAIEVQGREDETLVLHDAADRAVRLLPLAITTAIEEFAGVTRFQLLCTAPDRLELRLEAGVRAPHEAFVRAQVALHAFLSAQGLSNVRVTHGRAPPLRHPKSGKLERVRYAAATRR